MPSRNSTMLLCSSLMCWRPVSVDLSGLASGHSSSCVSHPYSRSTQIASILSFTMLQSLETTEKHTIIVEEHTMATEVRAPQQQKTVRFIGGHLLVGNLPEFTRDRLGLLQRMANESDVIGMHFGPFPGILFNRPEYVQSILVEHAYDFDKGTAIHNVFRPAIGDGIFSSEGDFHRSQRKLMAPSFQPRHIAAYAE